MVHTHSNNSVVIGAWYVNEYTFRNLQNIEEHKSIFSRNYATSDKNSNSYCELNNRQWSVIQYSHLEYSSISWSVLQPRWDEGVHLPISVNGDVTAINTAIRELHLKLINRPSRHSHFSGSQSLLICRLFFRRKRKCFVKYTS